jgi:hypothetical protein
MYHHLPTLPAVCLPVRRDAACQGRYRNVNLATLLSVELSELYVMFLGLRIVVEALLLVVPARERLLPLLAKISLRGQDLNQRDEFGQSISLSDSSASKSLLTKDNTHGHSFFVSITSLYWSPCLDSSPWQMDKARLCRSEPSPCVCVGCLGSRWHGNVPRALENVRASKLPQRYPRQDAKRSRGQKYAT